MKIMVILGSNFHIYAENYFIKYFSKKKKRTQSLAVTPRFNVKVSAILERDYTVNVEIKFIDTTSINMSDLVIHTVLTETDIEFEQAPGSNGETKFYDVTRLMLPTLEGTPIRQLVDQGELVFSFKDALLSSWNLEHLNFVVYIQDKNTKEVFQTGSTFE